MIVDDKSLFDIIWTMFDNQEIKDFQSVPNRVLTMLQELDGRQIQNLLDNISQYIEDQPNSSINFALLLTFKRSVLDCLIQLWPEDKLKHLLKNLHPMECIYVILNSMSTDFKPHFWFDDNLDKAYHIYEYIVRWINHKVVGDLGDELYYETYYSDYGRQERKNMMTLIGNDLLVFVSQDPSFKLLTIVNNTIREIVPLLDLGHGHISTDSDLVIAFWKFYIKLLEKDCDPRFSSAAFYESLSINQIRIALTSTDKPGIMIASPSPPALSPKSLESSRDMNLFVSAVYKYAATQFERSMEDGQSFLKWNKDVLSTLLYPDFLNTYNFDFNLDEQFLAPVVRLILHLKSFKAILSVLNSTGVDRKSVVQTFFLQCALGEKSRQRGVEIMVIMLEHEKELSLTESLSELLEQLTHSLKDYDEFKLISGFFESIFVNTGCRINTLN